MKSDVLVLLAINKGIDNDGFEASDEIKRTEIVGDIKSIGRTEFYMAQRDNISVSLNAKINVVDYEGACILTDEGKKIHPSQVEYDGCTYNIIRSYKKSKTQIELVLQEVE